MISLKTRIGVILPSTNTTAEPEYWKIVPQGVTLHISRIMKANQTDAKSLTQMNKYVNKSFEELLTIADLELILFACTSGSFLENISSDFETSGEISKLSKIKIITTSAAVIKALRKLNSKKIAIVTPYISEINKVEKDFFESAGFDVSDIYSVNTADDSNFKIGNLSPEDACKAAQKIFKPDLDTIFISCTNFPSIDAITILEKDLGINIITSNQASVWAVLRECNINNSIKGYGRLLEEIY